MNRTTSTVLLCAATVGALSLTGCASTGSPAESSPAAAAATVTGTPAAGAHDAADVAFATDMIPHHAQAVEMADMVGSRSSSADVTALAARIKAEQAPEIAQMSGWLAGWGEPVPSSTASMSMSGSGTGMMSDADMSTLADSTGAAFDRMWVSMMIEHHQGAVSMAQTEFADGQNSDAKTLATSIVAGQTAEIATMTQLLTSLPAA